MKKCAVCETEIRYELEEFGNPCEPVCARCWLEGKIPGQLPEDQIKNLKAEIWTNENYLRERYRELDWYGVVRELDELLEDIEGTEAHIKYLKNEIEKIQSSLIVVETGIPLF